jgi:enamine deaminase RidA (YjgF/YER057c/UK114 family)
MLSISLCVRQLEGQRKKNQEPKSQVEPLPPEPPMALAADTEGLDFHISPLLKTGGLQAQIRSSLNDLIRSTKGETIIKLRAFVAGAGDARRVQAETAAIFTEHKLPLPVLSIIQVGGLGQEAAQVVIEAVVATRRSVNPNGLAFLVGQTGNSFSDAVARLKQNVARIGVAPEHVVSCTCFTSRIEDYEATRGAVQARFPQTAITVVQAVRDPLNDVSTCQAVGQLTEPPAQGPVVLLPNERAVLVNSHELVFTGLQLTFGSFLDDAHESFSRLQRVATAVAAEEVPVEVNAFSINAYAGSALQKSTAVPPSTFTAQTVEGLTSVDASGGLEAVLAPHVASEVVIMR